MFASIKLLTSGNVFIGAKIFSVTSQRNYKVAVVGASGGIGQPLSLLLKLNSLVSHLALHDIAPITPGVAVDLSHINTPCRVTSHKGPEQLAEAIRCASVVVIPAGIPRKPGMSRDDLFKTNAGLIRDIAKAVARNCPQAILAIVTNPVNSTVPVAAEILRIEGAYDGRRVMGVTTLDVVRSCTFIGELNGVDPTLVSVPVIGGHSGSTIIPLFSQSSPIPNVCSLADIRALTTRVQEAGSEVVQAKAGGGSATLSMAFAAAKFTSSVLRALSGEKNIVECAYVASGLCAPAFFANPVLLGQYGVERNLGFNCISPFETEILRNAMPELLKNIQTGYEFVYRRNR
ncbi:unnamed protein product [Arctia plantaginis]|uniref:Malate dehydrogenase n=1 Tax=Arctia plantaginis TaxID=874455 RepID=A0A8S0YMP9_ARCPL|nr:unnamed protein product [Arctia plantaginis]CAB3246073.1 unnamed protein product [Arctia plantaginis]